MSVSGDFLEKKLILYIGLKILYQIVYLILKNPFAVSMFECVMIAFSCLKRQTFSDILAPGINPFLHCSNKE